MITIIWTVKLEGLKFLIEFYFNNQRRKGSGDYSETQNYGKFDYLI